MRRPMIVALLLVVSVAFPAAAQQNGREHWVATWAVRRMRPVSRCLESSCSAKSRTRRFG